MNQTLPVPVAASAGLPALITAAGDQASLRFLEFFAANIRNPHTRRAYSRAVADFLTWCDAHGVASIAAVRPLHVATWIEMQTRELSAPTVKQHLAAIRHLFDWLVTGQVMPVNPAASVRGPSHVSRTGKTPVLEPAEARALIDSIDITTPIGLRDRALIALMVYTFARVGAVLQMRVEDVYVQDRRSWVRLHEKRGKKHEMPCHHNLEVWLRAYIDGLQPKDGKSTLFRTVAGRTGQLSERAMAQADVFRMIGRRAEAAGIRTRIGCHSFRATGITEYLRNGGKLEIAQQMANHESARTTGLYDRRTDQVNLDEVERIVI